MLPSTAAWENFDSKKILSIYRRGLKSSCRALPRSATLISLQHDDLGTKCPVLSVRHLFSRRCQLQCQRVRLLILYLKCCRLELSKTSGPENRGWMSSELAATQTLGKTDGLL